MAGDPTDLTTVEKERDLYLRILDLGRQTELEPFVKESLSLIVGLTGASQGYLELRDPEVDDPGPAWWLAHGCSDEEVETIRAAVSHGIIADALATGRTIATASAVADPRFEKYTSVHEHRIEAVLCAPIGEDPPIGVVYLQGRPDPGPFTDADRANAEVFGRHIAPLSDRLLVRKRARDLVDRTRPFREQLQVEDIVGRSEALASVLREVAAAAPLSDVTVLLTGESGTGKTQLARALHNNSPRARGPFVELNVATLPDTLVESELFGALAGAYTGATRAMPGKIKAAEGGTLFLDEIAELPLAAQAKLLQVLQSREYYPLGSSTPVRADVRIIAATNQDLLKAISAGRFRDDLYYRLEVLTIRMPTLAERREDIPELARALCAETCQRNRLPHITLSPGALRVIETADWPGNVRQLWNAIDRAVIRAAAEALVEAERRHVFPDSVDREDAEGTLSWQQATAEFQQGLLRRTLEETNWNVTEAARRLDLVRSHVYNKMKSFGVERESGD